MNQRLVLSALLVLFATAFGAQAAPASPVGFQSEDHKVGCYLSGDGVRCDVHRPKWEAPPKPPSCELDWGQGVFVGRRGPAEYVCAGDTALDSQNPELAVGEKIKRGRFKCKALDASLVKCINKRSGEGFAVSRFEVHLFSR